MDKRRYYGFDALRGGMMMLGIVLHGATFYLSAPPPTMPIMTDRNTSFVMDVLFHFIHSFRMPVFFIMAGFFASLLVDKRGTLATLKNRAARILAPFLVGLATVLPLTLLLVVSFMVSVRFGTHEMIPKLQDARAVIQETVAMHPDAKRPSPMHLWFLYYLCYFYLLIPLIEWCARHARPYAESIGRGRGLGLVVFALAFVSALTLWPYRGAQVHEGFLFFEPHVPSLFYYGLFFIVGYLLNGCRVIGCLRLWHPAIYGAVGMLAFPVAVYASAIDHRLVPMAPDVHVFAVLANTVATWGLMLCGVSAALRWFDRPSSWALYISQSSYWVFLAHMPLIAFSVWLVAPLDWPALMKFFIVVAIAMLGCFVSYHYWIQRSWISVFLNGRRFNLDWPWRKMAQ